MNINEESEEEIRGNEMKINEKEDNIIEKKLKSNEKSVGTSREKKWK